MSTSPTGCSGWPQSGSAPEALANIAFLQADAQVHPFTPVSSSLVLSRFGAMFFADQAEAFGNLARALRRGGRLVLMSWRSLLENEWIRSFAQALAPPDAASGPPPEGPGPFAHAQPERTRAILEEAGFADITMEPVDEPMYFGRDADEGHVLLSTSLAWMAGDVDDDTRRSAFARLADSLRPRDGRGCGLRLGCLARDRQQARLVPDPESVHPSLDGAGGQPLSVGAGGEPTRPQSRVDPPTKSGRPAHKVGGLAVLTS